MAAVGLVSSFGISLRIVSPTLRVHDSSIGYLHGIYWIIHVTDLGGDQSNLLLGFNRIAVGEAEGPSSYLL
ncbi:hypothetical protein NEOLEDRAFT_1134486 [Neolentinus lepideus HHB14362 ss-1]|uniref:Uncharacterized protein n=1 Tax=Neolentinus lepideus HHB14362 ss-1 TaxID=1314782 RepID=A0A165S8Y2_9AGAM|nr:hypothetical protein NEOLEDRAFT_1134486 [Neolentinus lepideus HHB14362 ss-1]